MAVQNYALSSPGVVNFQTLNGYQRSALKRYIDNRLIPDNFPSASRCSIVAKRTLQLSAILVAAAAQAGMVEPNMLAAGSNKGLGGILTASNLSSFGSFYAYCSWIVLNDTFRSLSKEEEALFQSEVPPLLSASLKAAAAAVGALSQTPMAYAAYDANGKDRLALFFAVARFLDAGLPIRSLYLGAKAVFGDLNLTEVEAKLVESRLKLCSILGQKQLALLSQPEEANALIHDLLNSNLSADEFLRKLLLVPSLDIHESEAFTLSKKGMLAVGHLSNLCVMVLYGLITYHGVSLFSDDEGLKIAAALLVVACKFYLWKEAVSHSAREFPSDINNFLGRRKQPSISNTFMPKTDTAANIFAYAVGGFSYGSMKYFSDLYGLGDWCTAATSIGTALMAKSTFSKLKDGFIEEGLIKWGNEDQKRRIALHRKIGNLSKTVSQTCKIEWARFLLGLPEDILASIKNSNFQLGEVVGYLSQQQASTGLPEDELANVFLDSPKDQLLPTSETSPAGYGSCTSS